MGSIESRRAVGFAVGIGIAAAAAMSVIVMRALHALAQALDGLSF